MACLPRARFYVGYVPSAVQLQTCCKPNWDNHGADPKNSDSHVPIAVVPVVKVSKVTPSSPAGSTARYSLDLKDFLQSQ